jgi:hypothetical protein
MEGVKYRLKLFSTNEGESWFENYAPEAYQLNSVFNEGSLFLNPDFARLGDLITKGTIYVTSQPNDDGNGFKWTRFIREEIEEIVEKCVEMLNQWTRDLVVSEIGSVEVDENTLFDFRNGFYDSEILTETIESLIEEEDLEELTYTLRSGREIETQHMYAGLGLWKIDHAMTAIKGKDAPASAALAIDAAKAIMAAESIYYRRERLRRPSDLTRIAQMGAKARHAKTAQLRKMAIALYKARSWKSVRNAAQTIYPQIAQKGEEIGHKFLDRGQQTVYEWLLKSRKES